MPQPELAVSLSAARERYLEVADDPGSIRPFVVASWQRSMEHEVDASTLDAPYLENPNFDVQLTRAALPILDRLHQQLANEPVSTMLTDRDGVVLTRMVSHELLASRLNRVQLAPGHVYSERHVGTNGIGTALASRRATTIVGSEHYVEALRQFQCAAVPIIHPTRGTLLGAFNLTATRDGSAGMLMALARSTAQQIENEIAAISSRRERALFQDYMEACSSARPGAVLALNREVVMMNEQFTAAVSGRDHYALLDCAREIVEDSRFEGRRSIALPSGRIAELGVSRCRREDSDAGAVFRVRLIGRPVSAPGVATMPLRQRLGLIGSSPEWVRAVADSESAFAQRSWFCLRGEAGVGKTTLVEALHREYGAGRTLVPLDPPMAGSGAAADDWLRELGEQLSRPDTVLLVADTHLLSQRLRRRVKTLLAAVDRSTAAQLVMTTQPSDELAADDLDLSLDVSVEVPPIRHRYEDIEKFVRFFLRRYRPHGETDCSAEALAMLQQCPWPENIRQIESVMRRLARQQAGRTITAESLPPECRVSSRSVLTAMEALERDAILRGLINRSSNVQRTAQDLGISRATMYRKMRRYGIVPSRLT